MKKKYNDAFWKMLPIGQLEEKFLVTTSQYTGTLKAYPIDWSSAELNFAIFRVQKFINFQNSEKLPKFLTRFALTDLKRMFKSGQTSFSCIRAQSWSPSYYFSRLLPQALRLCSRRIYFYSFVCLFGTFC